MKVYRILHTPTGLFYTPSRGSGNLSDKGKLYAGRKPSLDWCTTIRVIIRGQGKTKKQRTLIEYFGIEPTGTNTSGNPIFWIDTYFKTPREQWEIVEVNE